MNPFKQPMEVGKPCPLCGRIVYAIHNNLCVHHGDRELAKHDFSNWAYSRWPYRKVSGWDFSYREDL